MEIVFLVVVLCIVMLLIAAIASFLPGSGNGASSTINRIGSNARSRIDSVSSDYLTDVKNNSRR